MSRCCAVVLLAFGVVAGSAETIEAKRPPLVNWSRLHRPFLPVTLAPDGSCPTTSEATKVGGRPIIGRYPVFLFMVGDAAAGEIELGPTGANGWRGQKTPWLSDIRYRGPILIRAKEVGGANPVAFANTYGQMLGELRYISGTGSRVRSEAATYDFRPSTTAFRTPGCYALQIDGKHFTRQLIVRVVDG